MKKFGKKMLFVATAACCALFFGACNASRSNEETWTDRGEVVATVNGANVYEANVEIFISQSLEILAWDHFTMFGDFEIDFENEFEPGVSFGDAVRREAVRLAAFFTVSETWADDLNIHLAAQDRENLQNYHDELLSFMTAEQLDEALRSDGFRGVDHLLALYGTQIRLEHMVDYFVDNPSRFEYFGFDEYMAEDIFAAAALQAEELLERARSGEDFSTLVATYGQDPGAVAQPDGYTFTPGTMVSEFEDALVLLEIMEISDIVQTQFGFHIIKRVEPNPDNLMIGVAEEGMELLGAKHILISTPEGSPATLEARMAEGVFRGLEERTENADFVFLPALSGVSLGDCCE
ncbi:MAG: peptidylprolyl isomerase [Defluviitaleaceae bacterium]|nr:peptidylprolyl isomerase [Defluviitaleaceae bacterium]